MKKPNYLVLTFSFWLGIITFANAQQITNVRFEQAGETVVIYYDLIGVQSLNKFDIKVYCSIDGGISYEKPLSAVSGDVGKEIKAGRNKSIIWQVLKERSTLESDRIRFKVETEVPKPKISNHKAKERKEKAKNVLKTTLYTIGIIALLVVSSILGI
jgi:hypothetical protein